MPRHHPYDPFVLLLAQRMLTTLMFSKDAETQLTCSFQTAGLALEEIDEIFGKPAAARLLDNDLIDETGAGSDKAAVTLEHEHAMQTGHTEKHMIES